MKKIIYVLAILLGTVTMSSCTSGTDELFDESANERVITAMNECKKVLCEAPNGWLMKYYPSRTKMYGGYNVLISFTEDGHVTVSSEVFDADEKCTSLYRMKEQAGPTLTLDTENEIFHFFSNPNSGIGEVGLGMEGDYEFTIKSYQADKVVLKGKKSGNDIILTPFPSEVVWSDFLSEIKASADKLDDFFRYNYTVNGELYNVERNNNNFTITYDDENGEETSAAFPFMITANGIEFDEPINLGGKEVSSLTYSTEGWKSDNGDASLVGIIPGKYDLFLMKSPWYLTYDGLNDYGKAIVDEARQNMFPDGDNDFLVVALGNFLYKDAAGLNVYYENQTGGILITEYDNKNDDQIGITFTGGADEVGVDFWKKAQNFALMFAGMSSETAPSYKYFDMEYDIQGNPTKVTLTEVGNEQNSFTMTCEGAYFDHQYE